MLTKIIWLAALLAGCNGGNLNPSYGAPLTGGGGYGGFQSGGYGGQSDYGGQSGYGGDSGHGGGYETPKAYEFGYAVRDFGSGNNYHRHEASDGNVVQGEYRVALPDGRVQVVSYTADWKNGYRATVRYEGTASHPDTAPGYHSGGGVAAPQPFSLPPSQQQAPVYGPPSYH